MLAAPCSESDGVRIEVASKWRARELSVTKAARLINHSPQRRGEIGLNSGAESGLGQPKSQGRMHKEQEILDHGRFNRAVGRQTGKMAIEKADAELTALLGSGVGHDCG